MESKEFDIATAIKDTIKIPMVKKENSETEFTPVKISTASFRTREDSQYKKKQHLWKVEDQT